MPKIVCIGILVADLIASVVQKIPERGKLELVDNTSLFTVDVQPIQLLPWLDLELM